MPPPRSQWDTVGEAAELCVRPSTLRRTVPIALVVGALLTAINLGGAILGGHATVATLARVVSNFVIPFGVSTLGFLSATRGSTGRGRTSSGVTMGQPPGFPTASASSIPAVTARQMAEVDRQTIEEFDLHLIQMMENAGIHLAELALRRFEPRTVTVMCGRGGNSGGGLAAARHLTNRGVDVTVTLGADQNGFADVSRHQLSILERMKVPIETEPARADLVLDALIGYSLRGDPRGRAAELIRWVNGEDVPVCSLDLPSGLNATTGQIGDPCVRASATLTLALPKTGLLGRSEVVGELYLADISIPSRLYAAIGVDVGPIFRSGPIVRLD